MDRRTYERVREDAFERVRKLTETKGKDYSTDDDALINFKRHAWALGLTPHQVWAVYAGKHWDAIQTFIRTLGSGHQPSEPIMGRIDDLLTYLTLLAALITEGQIETGRLAVDQATDGTALSTADRTRLMGLLVDGGHGDQSPGHVAGTLGRRPIKVDLAQLDMLDRAGEPGAEVDAELRQAIERMPLDQFLALDRALIARHRSGQPRRVRDNPQA